MDGGTHDLQVLCFWDADSLLSKVFFVLPYGSDSAVF